LRLGGVVHAGRDRKTLRVWWVGDLMGAIIATPLLLSTRELLATGRAAGASSRRRRSAHHVGGSVLAFHRPAAEVSYFPPHMLFPLLLWAALRFGPRGARPGPTSPSPWCSVVATVNRLGPFARPSLNESLLLLQSFMAMMLVTALVLAAAAAERADAVQAREDFISIASHELRTPLTPLTLQLDRLRRMLGRQSWGWAEVGKLQGSLERQTARLTTLVGHLLGRHPPARGPMRLQREKVGPRGAGARDVDGPRPITCAWPAAR
jgi:signal transduction histidine kinase